MKNNTKPSAIEENRQFSEMLKSAIEKLHKYTPEDITRRTNIEIDKEKSEFHFTSLGKEIHITYPDFDLTPELDMWYHLTILQYMDTADGTPLGNNLISLAEFKDGGVIRGTSFDRKCEFIIRQHLGNKPEELVRRGCELLGGKIIKSKADLSAEFSILPNFPITVNIWFADDELDGSGKILLNSSAEHYLSVEAAGGISTLVLQELINTFSNKNVSLNIY